MALLTTFFPSTPKINASKVVSITPTITSGSAYSSGQQLGGIMTLPQCVRQDTGCGYGFTECVEVTILDGSQQNAAIDIWFFNQSPTLISTDHSTFSMTAANQALQCIGVVSVGSTYSGSASCSVSSNPNLNKPLLVPGSYGGQPASTAANIYAVAIIRAAATYTSTTALQFQFGLFLD